MEDLGGEVGAVGEQTLRDQPSVKPRTRKGSGLPVREVVAMWGAMPPDISEAAAVHNLAQSFTSLASGLLGRQRDVRRGNDVCRIQYAVKIPH
mgnify:FL=1